MTILKKNFLYSSLLTISSYVFPLITFPYVTRVLGVSNIGVCNYVDSIVQYFILFSMMGIGTIGLREIAKAKGDKSKLSEAYSSLLGLNLIFTLAAMLVLLTCIFVVPGFREYKFMFLIGFAKILSNTLLVEWLFKGLEDFKYITTRSIVVRVLYVIAVIVFVKQESDYIIYFLLTTMMVVVNALINILYSRKFVRFKVQKINISPYLKSSMILGGYALLTSMYTTFNIAFLGFVTNTTEVGFYSTATKLSAIIMSLYSAFTGVMMPRMCSILSKDNYDDFKKLARKSIDVLWAFAMPLIVISEVCAPQIINIIAGPGYDGAILPMRIVVPLIFVIAYEQVLVLQILTPLQKDTAILRNSIVGATTGIVLNILLVPSFAAIGTSFVWVFSEIAVLISAQYFVNKFVGLAFPLNSFIKRTVYMMLLLLVSYIIEGVILNDYMSLIVVTLLVLFGTIFSEVHIFKNELIIDNIDRIRKRLCVRS